MLILYSGLILILWPLVLLVFVWRFGLRRTLGGLPERLGMGAGPGGKRFARGWIWIHAASVGEVRAAEAFLKALPGRFPGHGRLLTTTTAPGRDLAETLGLAECVRLAPADFPACVSRLLDRWSPAAAVLVETELWPNVLAGLARRNIPAIVINGRVSDRSFPRYRLLRRFWEPLLGGLARAGVQSPVHASRFLQLGAHPERVVITGNLKQDVPLPDLSRRPALFPKYGFFPSDRVWVCGSTHPGEEEVVLKVFAALRPRFPDLRLLLAPRHTERAQEVGELAAKNGLSFRLHSARVPNPEPRASVLLLNTVGDLAEAYGVAAVAFVGGSLTPRRGGQNPLEPARWGIPVLFGPHMANFRETAGLLLEASGAAQTEDGQALERVLADFLEDPSRAELAGRAAARVAASQRGAVEANLALLSDALGSAGRRADLGGCC